jgi:ABC-type branched-subunit amino acid transport system ATPase component
MALLEARQLSRWFGGLAAVQDVDLAIDEGQIVAVIGPNGAGKTTLFSMLSGSLAPTSGDVRFAERSIAGWTPERVAHLGLVRTFQNLRLFKRLTVLQNVMVGAFCTRGGSLTSWALPGHRRRLREVEAQAMQALRYAGLEARASETAMHLPQGEQRRLEMARALAVRPRLLLLDEPCAGLTREEMLGVERLIRRIRDDGVGVLFIEHDMDFVMSLAQRIAVLNFGKKIAEGPPASIREDGDVIAAYLGTETVHADR